MVTKILQVVAEESDVELIQKAAKKDSRSVSNFLLSAGIQKAKQILE